MKLHVVITDADGNVFEGDLTPNGSGGTTSTRRAAKKSVAATNGGKARYDFSLPARAFMKRYASSSSGPKRFALLVARLTKGQIGTTVETAEIVREWNAISAIMDGPYQTIYATRAKSEGWIDHPSRGNVTLLRDWTQAAE